MNVAIFEIERERGTTYKLGVLTDWPCKHLGSYKVFTSVSLSLSVSLVKGATLQLINVTYLVEHNPQLPTTKVEF